MTNGKSSLASFGTVVFFTILDNIHIPIPAPKYKNAAIIVGST